MGRKDIKNNLRKKSNSVSLIRNISKILLLIVILNTTLSNIWYIEAENTEKTTNTEEKILKPNSEKDSEIESEKKPVIKVMDMDPEEYEEWRELYEDGGSISQFAIGDSDSEIEFMPDAEAPPITIDGEVAYCLNVYKDYPVSSNYPTNSPYDNPSILSILYYGYPTNISGMQQKYNLSNEEARYYTQIAIWRIIEGWTGTYSHAYLDELLVKAKANDIGTHVFSVNPKSLNSNYSSESQLTNEIITGGAKGTFTVNESDGIWVENLNGQKQSTFNIGDRFKIASNFNVNGNKEVQILAQINKPAAIIYYPADTSKQDLVKFTWSNPIQATEKINVNFTGAGKIQLTKKSDTGVLMPGVKFGLFKDKNCSEKLSEKITNNDGVIEFSNLYPGTYYIKELQTIEGYVLNTNVLEVNVKSNTTENIDFVNNIIRGRIEIEKRDGETNESLQGAVFEIREKSTGNVVETLTTKADGKVISSLHPYGEYIVKEIKAPEKYVLNGKEYIANITYDNQIIKIEHTNNIIKGKVKIIKIDSDTDARLQGATFELIDKSTGSVVETLVTDANGIVTSNSHAYGEYILKEIKAPESYVLNDKQYEIVINTNNQEIEITHLNSKIKGIIEIIKSDNEIESLKLEGVKFGIYNEGGDLVEEISTNENGYARSSLLNYGRYAVREISTREGYLIDNSEFFVDITENGKVYSYDIKNNIIKGSIQIVKTDSEFTDKPIANAKFNIYAKDVFGIEKDTIVDTIISNEEGIAYSKQLRYGEYYIKEIEAPKGYLLDQNTYPVNISENGKTIVQNITNDPVKISVKVIKKDGEESTPLKDVKFKLINTDTGEEVKFKERVVIIPIDKTTYSTDENGEILFPSPLRYGNYQLVEEEAIEGYLGIEPINFSIDENTTYEVIENIGKVHSIEVINNKIKGSVELLKYDTDTKEPMKNVKFIITCLEGFDKDKTFEVETGEDGIIKVENINYGSYEISEVLTLDGYVLNNEPIPFEINEHGQNIELQMSNDRIKGILEFSKTDVTTSEIIEGAHIRIECLEGFDKGKVIEFISSKEGDKFELQYGKYTFIETIAPDGYVLSKESGDFEIKENGEIVKAELKNDRIKGSFEFSKTDVTTSEIIEGAHIKIECIEGLNKGQVIEFISSKEGDKFELDYGKYIFTETIAPDGYILSEEVGEFEIKENGEIVKAELKNDRIKGILEFTKTDVTTSEIIEGAHIKIECIEGFDKGKVIEFISSKEGDKFELQYGKYTFTETIAPDGYILSEEVGEFEIKENGEIVKAELKNKKDLPDMPYTGGKDTRVPLAIGLVLVILGGIIIFKVRKKN